MRTRRFFRFINILLYSSFKRIGRSLLLMRSDQLDRVRKWKLIFRFSFLGGEKWKCSASEEEIEKSENPIARLKRVEGGDNVCVWPRNHEWHHTFVHTAQFSHSITIRHQKQIIFFSCALVVWRWHACEKLRRMTRAEQIREDMWSTWTKFNSTRHEWSVRARSLASYSPCAQYYIFVWICFDRHFRCDRFKCSLF